MSSGVDFPLSNTCQFFSLNRGEEDGKAAKKGVRGREGGWEVRGGGIDLTLGESHHSSVHFHSSGLVMGVLIWQVGGRGQEGDLGG